MQIADIKIKNEKKKELNNANDVQYDMFTSHTQFGNYPNCVCATETR